MLKLDGKSVVVVLVGQLLTPCLIAPLEKWKDLPPIAYA
jgi:hypothetical protein